MAGREAKAGLEIAGMVYRVVGIDRSRSGWVKVTTDEVLSASRKRRPVFGDKGKLVTVTPRENLLTEGVGVLDHVFLSGDPDASMLFDFWFRQQAEEKVAA
jgi:hypothetical protein